jgi:hypothetical protein
MAKEPAFKDDEASVEETWTPVVEVKEEPRPIKEVMVSDGVYKYIYTDTGEDVV